MIYKGGWVRYLDTGVVSVCGTD